MVCVGLEWNFDLVVVTMSLKSCLGYFFDSVRCRRLGDVGVHQYGVTFNFGSAEVSLPAIFETCFSYDKDIRIAATDFYMYFYIIVLFTLTAILL